MPKPEHAPEPSIEEILASIRRIIADDAPAAAVNEAALDEQPEMSAVQAPARRSRSGDPSAPRLVEDEVLELTEDFMLAEEAPLVALQEPAEPQDFAGVGSYQAQDSYQPRDDYQPREETSGYRDPYDESFARHTHRPSPAEARMPDPRPGPEASSGPEAQDEAGSESDALFSAVAAEVQRFTETGPKDEPVESAPAAPSQADNWGQPDFAALAPQPARSSSRPVWSARRKEADAGQGPAEPAPSRLATPEPVAERKPDLASKEGWSFGVQMPVPDAGPAIPFAAEHVPEPRATAGAPRGPAEAGADTFAPEADPAAPAGRATKTAPATVHDKAEELAGKAVSDFTSDKLSASAPTVVADILRGDKPLMDAITTSLANALSSHGGEEPDEFEEAPHPEDFADDIFGAEKPMAGPEPRPSATTAPRQGPAMPGIKNLDGGFVAHPPVAAAEAEPSSADPEMPELPREDIDDIVSAAEAPAPGRPASDLAAYRPTGIAEPHMPNVPVAPSRAAPRPVAGPGAVREPVAAPERLQPVAGQNTLEDTIKEMLKPLLMQWLDENMPRIVNEALREEMAATGLLPRAREARR
jgi:cell pole-organizing protein PopZ